MNNTKETLKKTLKQVLSNEENQEVLQLINEVFVEEWLTDQEEEMLMVNNFASGLIDTLKNEIAKEFGEKFVTSTSKFSTLLSNFIEGKIIWKEEIKETIERIKKDKNMLNEVKQTIEFLNKEKGDNW